MRHRLGLATRTQISVEASNWTKHSETNLVVSDNALGHIRPNYMSLQPKMWQSNIEWRHLVSVDELANDNNTLRCTTA